MIDHFNLPVSSLQRSRQFYEAVLKELGYRLLMRDGNALGFGIDSWAFGLVLTPAPFPTLHLAFRAPSRNAVDRFYQAAIHAGAGPNGAPGLRTHYDPNYYAAFVRDHDGHNIEAVCRIAC